jgi:teichuronic acid biosynthesis glycosyltransferase TuaG
MLEPALPPEFADMTVVMPAFNAAGTIRRALRSIASQTVKPGEVIVVDDGSTDGTAGIAATFASSMGGIRLRVLRQTRHGPGAARNQAISRAAGNYLGFLDSDDEWLPQKVELSLAALRAGNLTMVAHNIIEISTAGEHFVDCRSRWLRDPGHPLWTLYLRGYVSSSTVVVRKADAIAAGGFNPTLASAQDYDLWLAILSRPATRFALFEDALLRYYLGDIGITGRTEERRRCNLRIMKAHLAALRSSGASTGPLVVTRALIIQWEALSAHWRRGHRWQAIRCGLVTPSVMAQIAVALARSREARRDFLAQLPRAEEMKL